MVRPPHVNHSRRNFAVGMVPEEKILFMGLDQVKHLTRRTIEKIIRLHPYHSLESFPSRVDPAYRKRNIWHALEHWMD